MNLPFKKGEKVVYPAHGVAVIEDIQTRVISGTERRFYMLKILGTEKMTIMIPTEQVESVGLRRVIGKDMVEKIYRILRQRKVEVDTQTWNRRYREYTEKIKTGSPLEIAKVLRDLLVLKGDKELSFGERKMLDTSAKPAGEGTFDREGQHRRKNHGRVENDLRELIASIEDASRGRDHSRPFLLMQAIPCATLQSDDRPEDACAFADFHPFNSLCLVNSLCREYRDRLGLSRSPMR